MALSTLRSDTHENLSDILRQLQSIALGIKIRRRILEDRTGSRQQFLHDLIDRFIGGNLFRQPRVVKICGFRTDLIVNGFDH